MQKGTAMSEVYRAVERHGLWSLEQELPCINGLSAWFRLARFDEPDAAAIGYTDGAIFSAEEMAKAVAATLNATPSQRLDAAPDRATVELCIHVLRGNFGAGRGPEALQQRDDDIAILQTLLCERQQPREGDPLADIRARHAQGKGGWLTYEAAGAILAALSPQGLDAKEGGE